MLKVVSPLVHPFNNVNSPTAVYSGRSCEAPLNIANINTKINEIITNQELFASRNYEEIMKLFKHLDAQ